MEQKRLNLYLIDMKYIRNLVKIEDKVMSVSPQIGKETRPFVGIVIICGILYNIYIKKPGYILLQPGMFYEREADYYGWTVDERF